MSEALHSCCQGAVLACSAWRLAPCSHSPACRCCRTLPCSFHFPLSAGTSPATLSNRAVRVPVLPRKLQSYALAWLSPLLQPRHACMPPALGRSRQTDRAQLPAARWPAAWLLQTVTRPMPLSVQ